MIFVLLILILLFGWISYNKEPFDIDVDMTHKPIVGKFDDCYNFGFRKGLTLRQCKDMCNKIDSCEGISYGNNECRFYNDDYDIYYDPNYVSYRNFWNKMY